WPAPRSSASCATRAARSAKRSASCSARGSTGEPGGVTLALDARAAAALPDERALARHDAAVWQLRARRDAAAAAVPDFEALRARAAAIKDHVLDHLDVLLERFEARAQAAGAVVHWAEDAHALCTIVEELL